MNLVLDRWRNVSPVSAVERGERRKMELVHSDTSGTFRSEPSTCPLFRRAQRQAWHVLQWNHRSEVARGWSAFSGSWKPEEGDSVLLNDIIDNEWWRSEEQRAGQQVGRNDGSIRTTTETFSLRVSLRLSLLPLTPIQSFNSPKMHQFYRKIHKSSSLSIQPFSCPTVSCLDQKYRKNEPRLCLVSQQIDRD